jgi:hypothetical protein
MKTITPKEFIQTVLIDELGEIHLRHPYISFVTMAIGIEFLGKCLNAEEDWNKSGQSKIDFEFAINNLTAFAPYRPFLSDPYKVWTSLRNGFLHSFVSKNTLSLSSGNEMGHLIEHNGKLNLKCENLYADFKTACEEVLAMTTFPSQKMSLPLLNIPDISDNISFSGTTY